MFWRSLQAENDRRRQHIRRQPAWHGIAFRRIESDIGSRRHCAVATGTAARGVAPGMHAVEFGTRVLSGRHQSRYAGTSSFGGWAKELFADPNTMRLDGTAVRVDRCCLGVSRVSIGWVGKDRRAQQSHRSQTCETTRKPQNSVHGCAGHSKQHRILSRLIASIHR